MTREDSPRDAAGRLAAALASQFHERNYTDEYIARRCRTTSEAVATWRTGAALPAYADWWYLQRIHSSFGDLADLWRAAVRESGGQVEDPQFVGDRRGHANSSPRPARGSGGDAPIGPRAEVVEDFVEEARAANARVLDAGVDPPLRETS